MVKSTCEAGSDLCISPVSGVKLYFTPENMMLGGSTGSRSVREPDLEALNPEFHDICHEIPVEVGARMVFALGRLM